MEKFNQYIDELRKHYKIQGEIKSTKTIVKKNKIEIMNQLYDKQAELNCNLVVEIVDKKFCMVERIIDYCVIPYYESPSKNHLSVNDMFARKNFANYISESISDKLLGDFVEFFDNNLQEIKELTRLIKLLYTEIASPIIKKNVAETLDSISRYSELGLLKRHLFPLADKYKVNAQ